MWIKTLSLLLLRLLMEPFHIENLHVDANKCRAPTVIQLHVKEDFFENADL